MSIDPHRQRERDEFAEWHNEQMAGRWLPIEIAPRGPWLLTISKNAGGFWCTPQTARFHGGEWVSPVHDERITLYHQPVAWMPLPDPPTPDRGGAT
jgi:hypothetical protein